MYVCPSVRLFVSQSLPPSLSLSLSFLVSSSIFLSLFFFPSLSPSHTLSYSFSSSSFHFHRLSRSLAWKAWRRAYSWVPRVVGTAWISALRLVIKFIVRTDVHEHLLTFIAKLQTLFFLLLIFSIRLSDFFAVEILSSWILISLPSSIYTHLSILLFIVFHSFT